MRIVPPRIKKFLDTRAPIRTTSQSNCWTVCSLAACCCACWKAQPKSVIGPRSVSPWSSGSTLDLYRPVPRLVCSGTFVSIRPVDLAAPLDLDRDGAAPAVPAQDVDRPDRRRVLPADQRVAVAQRGDVLGQQLLEMCLD